MRRSGFHLMVLFFTLAIGIFIHSLNSSRIEIPLDRDAEEFAVYSSLMDVFTSTSEGNVLLVASETIATLPQDRQDNENELFKNQLPDATSRETFEDYRLIDGKPINVTNRFMLKRKFILISNQEAKSYFEKSDSPNVREKYPESSGRITMLSRVGFNKKLTEALVYAWGYCGGECGGGGFYLRR